MALRFNGTEITKVMYNGTEQNALYVDYTAYFGKRFSLTQSSSTGVSFSVSRSSSPNQRAGTGIIGTGNTIYYGDQITISVSANANYSNPVLYVNTGSGMTQRTSSFTFTVGGDVTFYGSATYQEDWQTVWSGSQTFTSSGSFTVPGLATGGEVQISATIEFVNGSYDPSNNQESSYTTTRTLTNETLPMTLYSNYASVQFTRSGNQISFVFVPYDHYYKGFITEEYPTEVTFTAIRRKA